MAREIPQDINAERALLGAMIVSKETCYNFVDKANIDDFYEASHRLLFQALSELCKKGVPIDVVAITTFLKEHGQLDKVGGVDYLMTLSESVPTIQHADYYHKILHNKAILRKIIKETTKIAEEAYDDIEDLDDFIDQTEKTILSISRDRNAGEFEDVKSVLKSVTKRLTLLQQNNGLISGVETKFIDLDRITSGFQKGDLIILAARPAMGKTAFALNIAHNAAEKANEPVAIFSLEMPKEQLVQRVICSMGGIEGSTMRTGEVLKNNANKYYAAVERVSTCNLFIDDTPGVKINEIVAKCRKLKQDQGGLRMIIIDYLQLISGPSSSRESRQQEVSDISRQLKLLARELEVPVIALSQLSRSVEQRPNKRPMMSDLRESGAIEQDADIVIFLYREDYYAKNNDDGKEEKKEETGLSEVIIAKHRNGATGEVNLSFQKDFSRFTNIYDKGQDYSKKDIRS